MSKPANIKQVSDYFKTGDPERDTLKQFRDEWNELSDESREELRVGVGALVNA